MKRVRLILACLSFSGMLGVVIACDRSPASSPGAPGSDIDVALNGACTTSPDNCDYPYTCCSVFLYSGLHGPVYGNRCVDTSTNASDCGYCGNVCAGGSNACQNSCCNDTGNGPTDCSSTLVSSPDATLTIPSNGTISATSSTTYSNCPGGDHYVVNLVGPNQWTTITAQTVITNVNECDCVNMATELEVISPITTCKSGASCTPSAVEGSSGPVGTGTPQLSFDWVHGSWTCTITQTVDFSKTPAFTGYNGVGGGTATMQVHASTRRLGTGAKQVVTVSVRNSSSDPPVWNQHCDLNGDNCRNCGGPVQFCCQPNNVCVVGTCSTNSLTCE